MGQFSGKSARQIKRYEPQTSRDDFLHKNTHSEEYCPLKAKVDDYDLCDLSVTVRLAGFLAKVHIKSQEIAPKLQEMIS